MNYIKRTVAFACVAMLGLGLFSCKKCTTCNVVDKDGKVVTPGEEVCGKKADIDKAKEDAEAAAAILAAFGSEYDVECTD